jgi:hypothetical protein
LAQTGGCIAPAEHYIGVKAPAPLLLLVPVSRHAASARLTRSASPPSRERRYASRSIPSRIRQFLREVLGADPVRGFVRRRMAIALARSRKSSIVTRPSGARLLFQVPPNGLENTPPQDSNPHAGRQMRFQ